MWTRTAYGMEVLKTVQKVCGHGSAESTVDSMISDVFSSLIDLKIF